MAISDYIIIYLSIGAPFAVYIFMQAAKLSVGRRLLKSSVTLAAWPVFASISVCHKFGMGEFWPESLSQEQILDGKIREIRNNIEEIVRGTSPAFSFFEWRNTFERYTGLAKAVAQSQNEIPEMELFGIGGQKNGRLGTVCLNRRNRNRLIFHHTQARIDFVDALIDSVGIHESGAALRQAIELSDLLGDIDATRELTAMLVVREQNSGKTPVIKSEQEVWNPPTPKPQPANRI